MSSVPSSTTPVLTPGFPLATLDAVQPAQAGRPRATGGVGAPGADVVLDAAALASGLSRSSKSGAAKKKRKSSSAKTGYASSGSLPKDLSFLGDPKLSIEEKLMRFVALMNAKSEAAITQKMKEMGGGEAAKTGTTSGSGGAKKKKGFWGKLLDATKVALPAVGLTFQVLKNPTTRAMLKQLGGPVLAAAASAFGFPQAAPLLAKLGPQIVDYAAAGLQAVEKAASAEEKASVDGSGSTSGSGTGGASATGSGKSEQLQMLELNRLVEKQKEMFSLASNMLKSMHDTRSHIINNLR